MKEAQLQVQVMAYLDYQLPSLGMRAFHIPNGGSRNRIEAVNLKRQGVRSGVPDIEILGPGGSSYWIELKTAKGSLRPAQEEWREWLMVNDFPYALCRSLADVEQFLTNLKEQKR